MAGNNSIGDFFLDIIPRIDKQSVQESVAFLGNLGNATKLFDAGKSAVKDFFGFLTETSEHTTAMIRFADSIGQPIQKVQQLQRMFQYAGLSAQDANNVMKDIVATTTKMRYGQFDFAKAGMAGLGPGSFTGDPFKDINTFRQAIGKMSASDRLFFADAVPNGQTMLNILTMSDKEYKDIEERAKSTLSISKKQGEANKEYLKDVQSISDAYEAFKIDLVSSVTPSLKQNFEDLKDILKDKDFINAMQVFTEGIGNLVAILSKLLTPITISLSGFKGWGDVVFGGKSIRESFFGADVQNESIMDSTMPPQSNNYNTQGPQTKHTNITHNVTIHGATDSELQQKYMKAFKDIMAESEMEHNLNLIVGNPQSGVQ